MFLYATLCTGEVSADLPGANRVLRKLPKQSVSFAAPAANSPEATRMKRELRAKRQQLLELAESLGYCLEKTSYFKQEFASSIARRLINRRGNFIYQATDYSIPGFSCLAAASMFASALLARPLADLVEEQQTVTWRAATSAQVCLILGSLLTDLKGPTAGVSRGLRTASESCIRVIATLIPPLEVS